MARLKPLCPATSEAGARRPRFGLVVIATASRRDNKVQMIRPLMEYFTVAKHASIPAQTFISLNRITR
jgi:hypothetical protein